MKRDLLGTLLNNEIAFSKIGPGQASLIKVTSDILDRKVINPVGQKTKMQRSKISDKPKPSLLPKAVTYDIRKKTEGRGIITFDDFLKMRAQNQKNKDLTVQMAHDNTQRRELLSAAIAFPTDPRDFEKI